MLLRGVKFPPPALDNADIQSVKNKANNSGRSFGGAPLRNGGDRGGRINYAGDRPNPFAAHLDPNFVPPPNVGVPMMPSGWTPPDQGSAGFSRGPPPPPRGAMSSSSRPSYPPAPGPPQGRTGYGQGGYYGGPQGEQGYYQQGYHYGQSDYRESGSRRGGNRSQYPPRGGGYGRY